MNVLDDFRKLYIEFVNDDDMYPNYLSFTRVCDQSELSDNMAIKEFIVNSQAFENRVASIIHHIYPAFAPDNDVSETELIKQCVGAFRDCAEFSVAKLTDVLRAALARTALEAAPQNKASNIEASNIEASNIEASNIDASNIDASNISTTHDPKMQRERKEEEYEMHRRFIMAYEVAVKRPMYAYELLCFQNQDDLMSERTNVEETVRRLATNASNLYQVVSGLVMRYAGKHISEHDFTNEWMEEVFLIADDRLVDTLTERLMSKDVYIEGMQQRIRLKCQTLFDCTPTDEDVKYLFTRAAGRKMHLLDDAMDAMLADVWQEKTNDYREISGVYDATYGRHPDDEELLRHMYRYREKSGYEGDRDYQTLNTGLRVELCHDLEYQDNIKRMIQERYSDLLNGKTAPPRVLYDILRRVLLGVGNDIHDAHKLQSNIDANLQPYTL